MVGDIWSFVDGSRTADLVQRALATLTVVGVRSLPDDHRRALLVERQLVGTSGRSERSVSDVARTIGPLHSTDPSTAYLQIAARSDLSVADIESAFYEDRALLRHTTLRRTVHLLTPELASAAHGAYNHRLVPQIRSRLVEWLSAAPAVEADAATWLADVEERVVAAVERLDRPSGSELAAAVPDLRVEVDPAPDRPDLKPIRITSKVLELLIAEGRIARDRPRGGDLTSGAWTYSPITAWFPDGWVVADPAVALCELVAHKIASMPGCSDADLAWWTGLPKTPVRAALAALGAEQVVRDDGVVGWVAAADGLDVSEPGDDAVALLPGLDATPMGVQERSWFLGPHRQALFDRSGNIGPTAWWRGRVVGGWTQRSDGAVVTELLENVPAPAVHAIAAESRRLETWLGAVRVKWRYPTPLQRSLELS